METVHSMWIVLGFTFHTVETVCPIWTVFKILVHGLRGAKKELSFKPSQ